MTARATSGILPRLRGYQNTPTDAWREYKKLSAQRRGGDRRRTSRRNNKKAAQDQTSAGRILSVNAGSTRRPRQRYYATMWILFDVRAVSDTPVSVTMSDANIVIPLAVVLLAAVACKSTSAICALPWLSL